MLHSLRQPTISIIIPYYNHGAYIDETLQSIDTIEDKNFYEVIIVNDGSTDALSNERLQAIEQTGLYKVVWQENGGVMAARNKALSFVRGKYILPVDSDNRIKAEWPQKGVAFLEQNPEFSVVYCDYVLFGSQEGIKTAGPFNLQRLMLDNYIDNCSVIRASLIEEIGGYDTYKPLAAVEDWELWLRAAFRGHRFHYINVPLFYYRVLPNSGSSKLRANKNKWTRILDYLSEKYPEHMGPQYIDENILGKFRASPIGFLGKLILKAYRPKAFHDKVQKGKLRKYI
jgi:glycosyltransferase involved in cell wall biosynthesis